MQHYSAIVMKNVSLTVTTTLSKPYTMLKESAISRAGNEQFEGFAVDLIEELSKLMGFRYKFKLVSDKKYGIKNENGEWNGMIGNSFQTFILILFFYHIIIYFNINNFIFHSYIL